jgi:hypothetical protein
MLLPLSVKSVTERSLLSLSGLGGREVLLGEHLHLARLVEGTLAVGLTE